MTGGCAVGAWAVIGWCIVAALHAAPAAAQGGDSGSIVGYVVDQTGAPIRGVKINADSPTQIGGTKVTYTNDEGFFRIVGLLPGTFQVSTTAPKLRTVIQKDVRVGVNAAAEINVVMEVQTQVEEVKVVDKAPIVSTTTANVKEVFDFEFLDSLPVFAPNTMLGMVVEATPGANRALGNAIRVAGAGQFQRRDRVEGFEMFGVVMPPSSMAAVEFQTAGYGGENADAPGGVINLTSKSGSNKYLFDVTGRFEDNNLRFFTDGTDVESRSFNYYLNPSISGPIVKDRLWFYANADVRTSVAERDRIFGSVLGDPPPRTVLTARSTLKLTWQVTPRNKLSWFSSFNSDDVRNNSSDVGRDDRDAFNAAQNRNVFSGLIWEALLSDSLFLRSQVGFHQRWNETAPQRCFSDPVQCDHIPQVRQTFPTTLYFGNYELHSQTVNRSLEVINQLEWFLHSKVFGEHSLKAKSRFYGELSEVAESTPGDGFTQFNGTLPVLQRTYFANDPRLEEARYGWFIRGTSALTSVHSVQDAMRLTRHLTFTPGLALTTASAANVGRVADIDNRALTAHLSAAWDATHDGRTVVRGSFNQYVGADAVRMARFALGSRVFRDCRWNAQTESYGPDCTYGGGAAGNTIGLPCGATGRNPDGSSCQEKLKLPKTWEYTAGAEREIVPGVGVGADVIYRLFTYPYKQRETNRVWTVSGYSLDPVGGFRDGTNRTVSNLDTPADGRRRYLAVTGTVRKREGVFKVIGSYTWSRLEGNIFDGESGAGDFGANPARDRYYMYGLLLDDSRHNIRASVTWQATKWLSTGFLYNYRTGRTYQRKFRNEVENGVTDYRARVATDPGANINDPGDDRALRLPDIQDMGIQLRANLKPLTGTNLEAFADVLNVLALRTTTSVIESDGPAWGAIRTRMEPTRMRLGFRFRY